MKMWYKIAYAAQNWRFRERYTHDAHSCCLRLFIGCSRNSMGFVFENNKSIFYWLGIASQIKWFHIEIGVLMITLEWMCLPNRCMRIARPVSPSRRARVPDNDNFVSSCAFSGFSCRVDGVRSPIMVPWNRELAFGMSMRNRNNSIRFEWNFEPKQCSTYSNSRCNVSLCNSMW